LNTDVVETIVRRDRVVVVTALILVTLLAWVYLLSGAGMDMEMGGMDPDMVMPMIWTPAYTLVMFLMWWIMMIAMMLPSAAPMILIFAMINRKNRQKEAPYVPTAVFAAGYLIAWGGFSLAATILHWGLDRSGLLTMRMASAADWLGAALLLAAGVYQITPLKDACLRHCRSPIAFVMEHWRPGATGALRMGIHHGAYCVGCCWVVMGLLFYGGVMSMWWIVGLALLVLLEKVLPAGHRLGALSGIGFLAWGGWIAIGRLVS
jgi:predicted metal-binding membrane protein